MEPLFPVGPESTSDEPKKLVEQTQLWFGMLALKHGDGVVLVVYQTPESKAAAGESASADDTGSELAYPMVFKGNA